MPHAVNADDDRERAVAVLRETKIRVSKVKGHRETTRDKIID